MPSKAKNWEIFCQKHQRKKIFNLNVMWYQSRLLYHLFINIHKFYLKGHGNEADFLGFLHKSVRHRSLTLHFEPFRF
jgi:hypothetical protein